jgi:heme/copper-type cytochrome/quinol oxidase subunit 2
MPLITKIMLLVIATLSIVLTILRASRGTSIYSGLDGRPIPEVFILIVEMVILMVVGVTDFQRE